jgi:metal-responsive CopG/Arc/MetJ family transcriptional regulator
MSNQPTKEPLRTVPISMPFTMVEKIDKLARDKGCSRSELVRQFAIKGLAVKQKQPKTSDLGE